MKPWLYSAAIQSITIVVLLIQYFLLSYMLTDNELTLFLLLLSITSISLIILDAPFIFHSITHKHSVVEALESSNTFRHFILGFTLVCALVYWASLAQKYELTVINISLFLVLHISEAITLNYLLIIAEKGHYGQVLRMLKILIICFILYIWEAGLTGVIGLIIILNFVNYLLVIWSLSKQYNIKKLYFVYSRSVADRISFNSYMRNLTTVTGGLLVSMTIPFASAVNLDTNALLTLIISDRYVRNCENVFQSVIAWNFKKLNHLRFNVKWPEIGVAALLFSVFLIVSPAIVSFIFNTNLSSTEILILRIYCFVALLGPVLTVIGLKRFVYQGRPLEFSVHVIVMGLLMWVSQIQNFINLPLQVISPVLYFTCIIFLIHKSTSTTR